jgi:hypothetical protein
LRTNTLSSDSSITKKSVEGNLLQFESRAVSGTYQGTLAANGEINGEWSQGPGKLPLNLKRAATDKSQSR